jgi:hypothetical protein
VAIVIVKRRRSKVTRAPVDAMVSDGEPSWLDDDDSFPQDTQASTARQADAMETVRRIVAPLYSERIVRINWLVSTSANLQCESALKIAPLDL